MTAPIFIEPRGLSGLGTDFVPGQSYQSIVGEGYVPVPQEARSYVPPAPMVATSAATAAPASTLFGLPRWVVYAGGIALAVVVGRKLMR